MTQRINLKVFKNNKFYGNDFAIIKYEGHLEVIKEIYKKHGFTIEVI